MPFWSSMRAPTHGRPPRCRHGSSTTRPGRTLRYWHVGDAHRGLTRQRNFALDHVTTDLVAFFDDDVVLAPNCLGELERVFREDETVVGVGCFDGPETTRPRALWRLRRHLGMISSLDAGKYHRSGMSTPWDFDTGQQAVVEGDWMPGWGMMWKTAAAARARFHEGFAGYSQGEDLDFSLRLRRQGRLLMARRAGLRHLPNPVRPSEPVSARLHGDLQPVSHPSARPARSNVARCDLVRLRMDRRYLAAGPSSNLADPRRHGGSANRRPAAGHAASAAGALGASAGETGHVAVFLGLRHAVGCAIGRGCNGGRQGLGQLEFTNTEELLRLHAEFDVPACFAVVGSAALPGDPALSRSRAGPANP